MVILKKIYITTFLILIVLSLQVISLSISTNNNNSIIKDQNMNLDSFSTNNKSSSTSNSIVVTQPFIADFVKNIVGDQFSVSSIIKGTEDPHSYTPTLSDTLAVSSANIFMYFGIADIDGWASGIISAIPSSVRVVKLVNLSQDGLYDPYIGSGELNPHLWMWPSFVNSTLLQRIYEAVVQFDPVHSAIYEKNLQVYRLKLDALIGRIQGNATLLKDVKVVEYHAAYFYLLREMNVTRLGAIEQIEDQQPSAVHFANISSVIKKEVDHGNTVVIVQSLNIPPDTTYQVARDTGAQISYVAALIGNYKTVNLTNYIQMIDYDLVALTHPVSAPNSPLPGFELPIVVPSLILISSVLIILRKINK